MKRVAIVATCVLLLTSAAWAEAYVGASLGQADTGLSGDDTGWKIVGGYAFMEFLGVEGSYRNLGGADQTIGTTQIGLDVSSMDIFGVGRYSIGDKFDVFGKAGFAFLDFDASITDPLLGTISTSTTETEFALGVGVSYRISEKIDLRAEYETFDIDMISVGGVFKF